MRRVFVVLALAAVASFAAAPVAQAQDVELRGTGGRMPPAAYYQRTYLQPDVFELRDGWRNRLVAEQQDASAAGATGVLPIAVIPALFAGSAPPPAVVTTAALQQALFDGPATETVTGYFTEASHGQLSMSGHVTGWVQTSLTIQQVVGNSNGLGGTSQTGQWLRQAIAGADASVNFASFDNDGPDGIPNSGDDDGKVDGAAFLFHEVDAACGGPGIWPHRSRVSGWGGGPAVTNDLRPDGQPIVIDDYIVLGAMDCSGTQRLQSNVFAHEMGHVLGLPDYYDSTSGLLRHLRRWVVGCWEIMSAGSWGCGSGPQNDLGKPPHFGPFPKTLLGWITPRVVPAGLRNEPFVLTQARTTGDALRVNLSAMEYLLIELRTKTGFDANLPAGGVLIYHVELGRAWLPAPGAEPKTYGYALLEADGQFELVTQEVSGGNRGDAGDVWGVTRSTLHNSSVPHARLNGGAHSTVQVNDVALNLGAGLATVRISTATTPEVASGDTLHLPALRLGATASVRAFGGTTPFTGTMAGLPAGLEAVSGGDRLTLVGVAAQRGTFPVTVSLTDHAGATATGSAVVVVSRACLEPRVLMNALANPAAPLSANQAIYMDSEGNRNGRYDVGDLRAYVRGGVWAHASAAPPTCPPEF